MPKNRSQEMDRCIDNCQECHEVCLSMVDYCLRKGGHHAGVDHIRLLLDCAEICAASADFMIRGSELHTETCRACSEVCERCAEDCAGFTDDSEMKSCAEVCRRCAASCSQMAGAIAGAR